MYSFKIQFSEIMLLYPETFLLQEAVPKTKSARIILKDFIVKFALNFFQICSLSTLCLYYLSEWYVILHLFYFQY